MQPLSLSFASIFKLECVCLHRTQIGWYLPTIRLEVTCSISDRQIQTTPCEYWTREKNRFLQQPMKGVETLIENKTVDLI